MRPVFWLLAVLIACAVPASHAAAQTAPRVRVEVRVSSQKLILWREDRPWREYEVSTSKFGVGSRRGSFKTPLGKHVIAKKIGEGSSPHAIFVNREDTGRTAPVNRSSRASDKDYVTTRILWLSGLEPGKNKGGDVDSLRRYIYIHGTPDEGLIGSPASHGCIRMRNADVADLFERVDVGVPVDILMA